MKKWEKFSDKELLQILKESKTYKEAVAKLGYAPYTTSYKHIREIEEKLGYKMETSQLRVTEEEIVGQRFDRLVIISLDKEKSKEKRRAWVKAKCDCGNEISVSLNALRRGNTKSCGCKNTDGENLTNKKFGRWTALYRVENRNGETYWHCRCECGIERDVRAQNLQNGASQSCGCLQKDIVRDIKLKDLTNKKFGKLTALERDDSKQQDNKTYWKCQCDCGNIAYVQTAMLLNGNTTSCGCRKKSSGEEQIKEILQNNNIDFQEEYTFSDLKGNSKPLRFDFAIFSNDQLKYLIECQGIQHFKQIDYFKDSSFELQQKYDNLKRKYCKEHNILLIEIDFKKNRIIKEEEIIRKELL